MNDQEIHRPRSQRGFYWLSLSALTIVYFVSAKFGLMIDAVSGFATLVWPPSGIALAALLMGGGRFWPAITIGAWLANVDAGAPFLTAGAIATGNTLAGLLAYRLLQAHGFQRSLSRTRDAAQLVGLAALGSSLASATVGTLSLWGSNLISWDSVRTTWGAWWVGDCLGILLISPLILIWCQPITVDLRTGVKRVGEMLALTACVVLACLILFEPSPMQMLSAIPLPYFIFPLVIWSALRFNVRTTITTTFIISAMMILATTMGQGPFAQESISKALVSLQFFLGTLSATALMLATAVAERIRSDRLVMENEEKIATESRIRAILHTAYDAFISIDDQGLITDWNPQAEITFGWRAEEVLGRCLSEIIIPHRLREAHQQGLKRFLATGEGPVLGKRIELPTLHRGGKELPVEITISPVKRGDRFAFNAFLHDISDRKRIERLQAIHLNVTRVLTEARTISEAFTRSLEAICQGMEWDFGALWVVDSDTHQLVLANAWHQPSPALEEFMQVSVHTTLAQGAGLPGRVWRNLEPCWLADITLDSNFARAPAAIKANLHTALAFPLRAGDEVFGVIEFISHSVQSPDDAVINIMTDIVTRIGFLIQRRRAEDNLRQSEERYRLLVGAVRDYAIFMLDATGHVMSWNAGAEQIKGYTASEIIGKHISIFYPPKALANSTPEQVLNRARQFGRSEAEGWRLRKDGTMFFAYMTLTPLYNAEGVLYGYTKVTRDITEQKKTEEKLRLFQESLELRVKERTKEILQRESQLRLITDALPVMIAQVDADLRYIFVNDAYRTWYGKTQSEILGSHIRDIIGDELFERFSDNFARALRGERVVCEPLVKTNGQARHLNVMYLPDLTAANTVNGFLVLITDITRHKLAEEELTKAKEAAEAANHAKSAFLANMSHEIRTPLGVVIGFSELMLNPQVADAERANAVEAIKRNGALLSNIINDILDLSKVEAGKLKVERIETSLWEIIEDVTVLLNLQASEKGIQLFITSEGAIPSFINTDPLRLKQILFNIIGNAIKFTAQGEVSVKIKQMGTSEGRQYLAFAVKDSGVGISRETAQKLFDVFTQADISTTRRFGGTGLGLALSRRLANLLGGDVILTESAPGQGSTFTITIDPGDTERVIFQSYEATRQIPEITGNDRDDDNSIQLRGIKVLLVEDSPDNQLLVSRMLKMAGAEVHTANNGRQGMEKALRGQYDAVLMDLQMPEMDGFEATTLLRKQGYKIPIIALTAHAMKEERNRCLALGFDDHLGKPINLRILLERLHQHTSQR